jgi:hypothetical protein
MIPSVALLPEPMTTYRPAASSISASRLTGMTRTPSATPKGGSVVARIDGDRYVASTTRRHTVAGPRRKQGYRTRAGYELQTTREIPVVIVEPA